MEKRSYSQAGQDLWVVSKFPPGFKGIFLDIGCSHPTELSNTFLLEQLGWSGWGFDVDRNAIEVARTWRPGTIYRCEDAVGFDFRWLGHLGVALEVDYLSLDIDHPTLDALRNLLTCGVRFKVATIEHDAYRFGDELRAEERRLLREAGYILERADVESQGCPFEDWWVHPTMKGA